MKKSEDDHDVVLRIYEASGQPNRGKLSLWQPFNGADETNLIEWNSLSLNTGANTSQTLALDWKPTEIKTIKLSLERNK